MYVSSMFPSTFCGAFVTDHFYDELYERYFLIKTMLL